MLSVQVWLRHSVYPGRSLPWLESLAGVEILPSQGKSFQRGSPSGDIRNSLLELQCRLPHLPGTDDAVDGDKTQLLPENERQLLYPQWAVSQRIFRESTQVWRRKGTRAVGLEIDWGKEVMKLRLGLIQSIIEIFSLLKLKTTPFRCYLEQSESVFACPRLAWECSVVRRFLRLAPVFLQLSTNSCCHSLL